jgi:Fe-S-cluster containining protein
MVQERVIRFAVHTPRKGKQDLTSGKVGLRIHGVRVEATMTLPTGPTRMRELLPALHAWTNAIVEVAEETAQRAGRTVSCREGCGACCRQLVPIAPAEAHAIAALVGALPEPRQSAVRARFAEAETRLEAAGLRERLEAMETIPADAVVGVGLEYFALQLSCPFLEAESCSIHKERPVICREYLVTSDPEHCRQPGPAVIDRIGLPAKMSRALTRVEAPATEADPESMRGRVALYLI